MGGFYLCIVLVCGLINLRKLMEINLKKYMRLSSFKVSGAIFIALFILFCYSDQVSAQTVIFDDFEYVVNRIDSNAVETFRANGWSGAKTSGDGGNGANGYLYTVTPSQVEGNCGSSFPAGGSRALMLEARPQTDGHQTDFYMQLGNGTSATYDDYIPADAWIQFWVCNVDSGDQQSERGNRNKFLYVCNGSYGCHSHLWMISEVRCNYYPPYNNCGNPQPGNDFFWQLASADGVSNMSFNGPGADPYTSSQVGHNFGDDTRIRTNVWTLVKMRVNTSTTSGSMQAWQRTAGGQWVQMMDWRNGVNGFTWTIPQAEVGGHRELRMPTTVGHASDHNQDYDYFMVMDDFIISNSEATLPTYGVTNPPPPPPNPPPSPPVTVRADHYPSGTIFKYANNPTVYIKEGSVARPITDFSVYQNQIPATRSIVTIPSSVTFTQGEVLGLRNGTLIKSSDNPTVYLVLSGTRFAFSSAQEFFDHNYNFSNVYVINDTALVNRIPINTGSFERPVGTLFKYANFPAVYFLNNTRAKRGYSSINMFNIWNATLKDVITIPNTETYTDGPIATLPNGILVKGSSATIYWIYDGVLRPFTNMALFNAMGLRMDQVKTFSDSDLGLHSVGSAME
jgi:hypothetical protein